MIIPLIAFLFLYFLFILIWLIFSLIAFYHMIKYGQVNFTTFFACLAYLAAAALILNFSYRYLSPLDWSAAFTVFGSAEIFGVNYF